jgi:hypothetical protein
MSKNTRELEVAACVLCIARSQNGDGWLGGMEEWGWLVQEEWENGMASSGGMEHVTRAPNRCGNTEHR